MTESRLIGRSGELSRLRALIGPGDESAVVMLGEAGIGKSALLTDLADYAAGRGIRVLSTAGREQESALPFAGLRRLLHPVLDELLDRPGRHAEELSAALSVAAVPDALRAGRALVALLVRSADSVLLIVDDAHWMDSASLEVLAFMVRRPGSAPVTMACAATGERAPAPLSPDVPELRLGPLSIADAALMLQAQAHPVSGSIAPRVLREASGNPEALIELGRAASAGPATDPGPGPLPAAGRLSALFAAQLDLLPPATRYALLLAAVAGDTDFRILAGVTPGLRPEALAPAEELSLITVRTTGIRFGHPLLRSAVYYGAPFASRAALHRQMASALTQQPDLRAWHLGAASLLPDEQVSSLLAASAVHARRRGGAAAMALFLERAADLSLKPADQARHLMYAAEAALSAGQADWARDLANRALEQSPDPALRSRGQLVTASALASSGRYLSAAETLLPVARNTANWNTLGLAATAAYQSGNPEHLRAVSAAIAVLPPPFDDEAQAARRWAMAVTGTGMLGSRPGAGERALFHSGAAAWLADQTSHAIQLLQAARNTLDDRQVRAASDIPLAALGWACLDAGRWDDALDLAAEAGSLTGSGTTSSAAALITATIFAARGDTVRARSLVAEALAADPEHSRLVSARARHALGLCALAEGDYLTAFAELCHLFDDDGIPYHPHASYPAIGDIALAAARSGHRLDGRKTLKRISSVLAEANQPVTPRRRQLMARANGILADPSTPGAYSADVLNERDGDQWPFEDAQLDLEHGEWLRRRRRINDAKPVLRAALEVFGTLKAEPWRRRAESELRACGIAAPRRFSSTSGLDALTPQQRQIIRLVAEGLSNREIAQRLYLSPRTVASHLHRSFHKLGVTGRHQIHGLLAFDQVRE